MSLLSSGQPVPILMYHSISRQAGPRFRECVVSPERFAEQMAYLARGGYTPVTVSQLVRARSAGDSGLPDRPVVLTFDDGYADFYTEALPVLRKHGFAATLYVATGFVGGTSRWLRREGETRRAMLNWSQLTELRDSGIECGAHTQTHPHLDTLPPAEARAEIQRSKSMLEDRLGQAVSSFAYPFGHFDRRVRELVQAAGFSSACAVTPRLSPTADDPFALPRVMVHGGPNLAAFAAGLRRRRSLATVVLLDVRSRMWQHARRAAAHLAPGAAPQVTVG
jgi:peptidoglycan/xylan/chitin deacetylase (PgdA/CDA1 family)